MASPLAAEMQTFGKAGSSGLQVADHAAMGRAFGMHADHLPAALERALAHRPALLDVVVTPEGLSSDARSGLACVPHLQTLAASNDAEREWRSG
jgi:acetolactate synthase-1/2/3 large subunit